MDPPVNLPGLATPSCNYTDRRDLSDPGQLHSLGEPGFPLSESTSQAIAINYIPNPSTPLFLNDAELAHPRLSTEINPNTLAFQYLAAGASITSTLLHVKYGTFEDKPAGLIVFQTDFFFPAEKSRTTSAKITVKFIQSDPSNPANSPKIVRHQPRMQDGDHTTVSAIHDTYHANLTLQPPGPVNVGSIDAGYLKEKNFTRMHHTIIRSSVIPHSASHLGRQCLNTVVWSLRENEAQKSGVSPIFKGAVIVLLPPSTKENPNPQFHAQFKIEPNQACEIRQMYASLIQIFNNSELARFDSKTDFRADGLLERLEDNVLSDLLKLPVIETLPPGY
ncbi:hypothetical protein PILCRDRAFT_824030 [Piloderma croceum F 1598]|uniref:Uncharacterized protein n=1 Tax=Piloderma croceum (strain F 1598) TaxID=765440 RepID=A0A0C3F289_PILCF|nr:hypothetical protein PILCRDRAFT_824030 [Piloderma croceum F 1598]